MLPTIKTRRWVGVVLVCLHTLIPFAFDESPGARPDIASAGQLYRSGKFADAEVQFQEVLKSDPKRVAAQVGLIRSRLRLQKIDEASETANHALSSQPDSAPLQAAMGDVHYRRGEMSEAELCYLKAKKLDPKELHSYLGLAELYSSYSLYRHAYDQLQLAHEIAPDDIEVQRVWLERLPRKEQMAALEAYLAGPHPDNEDKTAGLKGYLQFLKATVDKPIHSCSLLSKVAQTATKLEMLLTDADHLRGLGLTVSLNGHSSRLLLDTGAGGITVSRSIAEKAKLPKISEEHFGGIGDKGLQTGYSAVADRLRIGDLEFQDCVVTVSNKKSIIGDDGLIGADVFSAYLIDIDIPGRTLKLSPLPKRPEDPVAPTGLNSEGEEQTSAEEKTRSLAAQGAGSGPPNPVDQKEGSATTTSPVVSPPGRLPKDRYVAPEMANWTKVFRFGHQMLIPTVVNDSKSMLFAIDTGSVTNMLSVRAARQVAKVSSDYERRVEGLSGEVKHVYSADKVDLRFGHLRQQNLETLTLDLSNISRDLGTEVSGLFGFTTLRLLEIKIDYRDGLVDFIYDPKRTPWLR
jgi:tetratricopeptide (TPR) repeat protein